jgi:peroxiredoxin
MTESFSAKLANIVLPEAGGADVRVGTLWERNPAVIVFLRHYGWIFCREHVAQLREHESEIKQAGATLAAIGLGDLNYARLFREETGITFPLLVDADRIAYHAAELKSANLLHLLRSDNKEARARAKRAGHRQHALGKNPFQLGASFIFAPKNCDLFVHISRTFGDNADLDELMTVLARAGKSQAPS